MTEDQQRELLYEQTNQLFLEKYQHFKMKYVDSFIHLFPPMPFKSNVGKFFIYDAVLSRKLHITPEMAIGRWQTELEILDRFAQKARERFSEILEQSVYFVLHILYYLLYGELTNTESRYERGQTWHKSEVKCPYTLGASNFIASLFTHKALCQSYTDYMYVAAQEFNFPLIQLCSQVGHTFPIVVNETQETILSIDAGYQENEEILLYPKPKYRRMILRTIDDLQRERFEIIDRSENRECEETKHSEIEQIIIHSINKHSVFGIAVRLCLMAKIYNLENDMKEDLVSIAWEQSYWLQRLDVRMQGSTKIPIPLPRTMNFQELEDIDMFFPIMRAFEPLFSVDASLFNLTLYSIVKDFQDLESMITYKRSISIQINDKWRIIEIAHNEFEAQNRLSDMLTRSTLYMSAKIYYDSLVYAVDKSSPVLKPIRGLGNGWIFVWDSDDAMIEMPKYHDDIVHTIPRRKERIHPCERAQCFRLVETEMQLEDLECVYFCREHAQSSMQKLINLILQPIVSCIFDDVPGRLVAHLESAKCEIHHEILRFPWEHPLFDDPVISSPMTIDLMTNRFVPFNQTQQYDFHLNYQMEQHGQYLTKMGFETNHRVLWMSPNPSRTFIHNGRLSVMFSFVFKF